VKRRRREQEEFSMSFLDVICCGFGAIILLLMITKTVQPLVVEQSTVNVEGLVQNLQEQLFRLRGETLVLNREMDAKHEQLSEKEQRIAILRSELDDVQADIRRMASASSSEGSQRGELYQAMQSLTAEMERLLGRQHQRQNNFIGGIPVDSEYLIFIIDTSGSMFNYGWQRMMTELVATLDIYPQVKGIQVMSDMGEYMFSNYRGEWIPDTPGRREVIMKRLRNWNPFSNSSPVEGIERAMRTFYDPNKKISLYVMGDEFTGNSIAAVVRSVDRLNKERKPGERMVRIHAVGFPVQFSQPAHLQTTGIRFAALMRELTYQNGGTFVGLNDFR
jgi:hypothetical protein